MLLTLEGENNDFTKDRKQGTAIGYKHIVYKA